MVETILVVIFGVALAILFDFGNGLNDAANAISTVVATRVMKLRHAVIMSAFGNFVGFFIFGVAVATTIGKGLIIPSVITPTIIIAGLIAAALWVYGATWMGIPVSASHALIGGFVGSAVMAAGFGAVIYTGVIKVLLFIFLAPIIGFLGGTLLQAGIFHIFKNANPRIVTPYFKRLQILSAAAYSISHGTNDAQKTVGIIAVLLFSAGLLGSTFYVPTWVLFVSYTTIALGTLAGGRKVIKTMGLQITKLRPVNGFCAETAGSAVVMGSTLLGIPVSTTHVISGSIMGVGALKRTSAVRWGVARRIIWAWVLTIPLSASIGALTYALFTTIA